MKILKGLGAFVVFVMFLFGLGSCFDEPTFGPEPFIEFEKIEFVEIGDFADADSLNIYIRFRDGDGNLGLSPTNPDHIRNPYHPTNFFRGYNGQLTPVSATLYTDFTDKKYKSSGKTPTHPTYRLDLGSAGPGTFVSLVDRNTYGLPPFESPYTCTAYYKAYMQDTILVRYEDRASLKVQDIVDTLLNKDNLVTDFAALQAWYIEVNPNHYNITVKFLIKQSNGTFEEFDFREEFCTTWDQRIPPLSEDERALEGTLMYAMVGSGFLNTFSVSTLKLEVQIKDRELNKSNIITTPEFTLNGIRKSGG